MTLQLARGESSPNVLTDELAMDPEVSIGGIVSNNYTYVNAQPIGPWAGSRSTKININLPQELISLEDAYLEFQITATAGNTVGIIGSFVPDIRSIISRMTVNFGSKTILDIDNWGLLQNVFNYTNDPLWNSYNGSVLVASDPSQANRQEYFTTPTKVYTCRLNLSTGIQSIFNKMLPLQKLGTQFTIYLYLSDPVYVISTNIPVIGSVAPSYTVNQVELHYITSTPTDGWNRKFDTMVRSNPGITFTYRTFDNQQDTSTLIAGITSASKFLTFKYTSLLGLLIIFQPTGLSTTWNADNKMNYFYNPGVNLLRLKIGGQFYPTDSSTNDGDVFGRLLTMTGIGTQTPISASQYWNYNGADPSFSTYIACCPISKHPNSIRRDNRIAITGLNTSVATSMQLDLGFSPALPANLTMNIWAYYESTIVINPNGSVTLYT